MKTAFRALGKSGVNKASRLLESFPAPLDLRQVLMVSDEVTALCPATGQPDQYTISIEYLPDQLCVESKSAKLRFQSYREKGIFCEALAHELAQHVVDSINPFSVTVKVAQKSRGGVSLFATASQCRAPATSGVYKIVHIDSGKTYVGSSVNIADRWFYHRNDLRKQKHCNVLLQRSWNKYGERAFKFEVLELLELDQLHVRENFWIQKLQSHLQFNLVPIAGPGTRGLRWYHSEETKKKISIAQTGRKTGPRTKEQRERMSAAQRGHKRSPESIRKGALSNTGNKRGPYSAEHRAKISAARKGKKYGPQTEEHRLHISEGIKRAKHK